MESNASISKLNRSGQRIHVEMGRSSSNEEKDDEDDLNESRVDEYKELSYKLFQFKTYKLRGFNGELRCPFCVNYEEGEDNCHYTHLLLHAVGVAEVSKRGKQKANHFAMARYLAIDLADEVKAEAEQLSRSEDGKRLNEGGEEYRTVRKRQRLDKDCTKEEALEKVRQLERELDEKTDQINDLIKKERLSNDKLQGARREIIKRLLEEDDSSLQDLMKEWGLVMHDGVVVALNDLREYNLSGCNGVPELWNFKEDRKAALDEVFSYILEAVKVLQRERCRREVEKKEKEWELKTLRMLYDDLLTSNEELTAKERENNNELKRAREELIKGLNDSQSGNNFSIGIKKLGEIDVNAFERGCRKRFPQKEAEIRAIAECSMWQEKLKYLHPFRPVRDDKGKYQSVLNDDDESLKGLKQEWGDEIYSAVVTAIKERHKLSPRRRNAALEIWNFHENRKAKIEEVISYVFNEVVPQKRRRSTGKASE